MIDLIFVDALHTHMESVSLGYVARLVLLLRWACISTI